MKAVIKSDVTLDVVFKLNEVEARALEALAGYGTDEFLKCFYKHMGEHYLKPHEKGLRSLFEKIKELDPEINKVNRMRESFDKIDKGD